MELSQKVVCPHCEEEFDHSFPDRRGKGLKRTHTWLSCPKCGKSLEITIRYTEASYEIKVEGGKDGKGDNKA